jgi:hypothetical protein
VQRECGGERRHERDQADGKAMAELAEVIGELRGFLGADSPGKQSSSHRYCVSSRSGA